MPKYQVIRSYDVVEIYEVEADNEDHAIEIAFDPENHVRTYDGPYDDSVGVSEGWEYRK